MSDIAAADGRRRLIERIRAELAGKPHGIDTILTRLQELERVAKEHKAPSFFTRILSLVRPA